MNFHIFIALAAFLISLLGTRLTILARRQRFKPTLAMLRGDEAPPVPGGGGIVVVFALAMSLLLADVNYGIVLALFILAAVSLLDDVIGVAAPAKLLVQLAAVSIPISSLHGAFWPAWGPVWLYKSIAAFLWVWLIRLFDQMDGIDGLAATETACIAGGVCLLSVITGEFAENLFSYSLATAAATAGFLWWNWHPAKIRLGEVGRVPLGFICGYLLLLLIEHGYYFAVLILPAYAIADGTLGALRRLPAQQYYRAAIANGWTADWVVRSVFGINLLLMLLAIMSVLYSQISDFIVAVAYMAVFMLLGSFAHTKAENRP